ncbi:oligopeptide transport ATP-binding protein AppF [Treponema primitia ZAS-2]|uniref:Oligopeptide transport ATP-binding protein AppF n=1 Tax=Treponema primitia (strain ATCC BAA-887 / DSM 12427 / ZAS-2) TaxID=545694 RepID=F5YLG1_TREPZ|nr:ATP-binding cassette domain-containing protein [Treponema primitia]AEF85868.1 oligopeptide transport ATP-binding protein AppF [Treponema primitia ZAS-2]
MNSEKKDIIMEAQDLTKYFPLRRGLFSGSGESIKAVEGVNLQINPGETLGIVGESGCGKSTLVRMLLGLLKPTRGKVIFQGKDISSMDQDALRRMRRDMQVIFQDPYAALNPRHRIRDMLIEPLLIHKISEKKEALAQAGEMLEKVELSRESLSKFPHEFSGGQRQRICIARALMTKPKLLICDECVSALDVSIQAQVLNLLNKVQRELGLTMVFVSHDLRVIHHMCRNIIVMYMGCVVENANKDELFTNPQDSYTKTLLQAIPKAIITQRGANDE